MTFKKTHCSEAKNVVRWEYVMGEWLTNGDKIMY